MGMTPTSEEVIEQQKFKIQNLNIDIENLRTEINQLKTLNGTLNRQINDLKRLEAKSDGKNEQLNECFQFLVDKLVENQT